MNAVQYARLEPIAKRIHEKRILSIDEHAVMEESNLTGDDLGNLLVILDAWECEESADRMTEYDIVGADPEDLKQRIKDIENDPILVPNDKQLLIDEITAYLNGGIS